MQIIFFKLMMNSKISKFAEEPELTIRPYFLPKILANQTQSNFLTCFPSIIKNI